MLRITLSLSLYLAVFTLVPLWAEDPTYWGLAPTPPMGWNSYDAYGSSVTEAEFMANAAYMKEKLLSHGWVYAVVDYRWSDATAADHNFNGVAGQPLESDEFGRLLPAPSRFPSAAGGKGFKSIADRVHEMGLKFGIHVMRGIPRQAVVANSPIEGSSFTAAQAANTKDHCSWCADMFGVNGNTPAGQAYYDSIMRLYAGWGVDFLKIDDLSQPYHQAEIEALRQAINKCGRPIVFSTSPGETPIKQADHISTHATMWRICGDFWDNWKSLNHGFDLAYTWQDVGGAGRWPDGDMIPFGRVGIRSVGGNRMTKFTKDEQMTLMSLWSLMPSPLMLGMSLVDNDDWTLSLLVNDEVLAVNQDPLGKKGRRLTQEGQTEVWVKELKEGRKAVGLFNRGNQAAQVIVQWSDLGLVGAHVVRDLWTHQDLGSPDKSFQATVPAHGVLLLGIAGN